MTEFLLDRLTLQELDVINDQDINRPEFFLEGDGRLRLQGGNKAIHELLSRQIDDPAASLRRIMGNGLNQMGFAQTHRGMDIEGVVDRQLGSGRLGHALGSGMSQLVRFPDQEGCESQTAIQGGAAESVTFTVFGIPMRCLSVSSGRNCACRSEKAGGVSLCGLVSAHGCRFRSSLGHHTA